MLEQKQRVSPSPSSEAMNCTQRTCCSELCKNSKLEQRMEPCHLIISRYQNQNAFIKYYIITIVKFYICNLLPRALNDYILARYQNKRAQVT